VYRCFSIAVIIPCYNEEDGIRQVLTTLPDFIDEKIVVNNESSDKTVEVAKACGATVIHESNKGYGFAYHAGFSYVQQDIIITMDGDGTYPVEAIEPLINQLIDKQLDFISGCRFPLLNPEAMDPVSKVGNWILTFTTQMLFGFGLKDSQSGMWVFKKSALSKMTLQSNGMALSEEIKIEAIKRKLKFAEIHIPYHERIGYKKIKKFKDGILNLLFLVKLKLRK